MSGAGDASVSPGRGWFDGKVALVTGASMGIGRAVAERFALEGASLLLTALEEDELAGVAQSCAATNNVAVEAFAGDLGDPELPARLVAWARERFGGVDVVVNVAMWEEPGAVGAVTLEGWDRTLRVTLTASMLTAAAALPSMLERGGGSIVNVSSMRAVASAHGAAAYESAKAGLFALTRSIAVDHGPRGIRCNCVAPGLVASDRVRAWLDGAAWRRLAMDTVVPLGRPGTPQELANVIAFVAGSEASYMNGAIVWVDGGALAGLPENSALPLAERSAEDEG